MDDAISCGGNVFTVFGQMLPIVQHHLAYCYLVFYSIWPNITYYFTAFGLMLPSILQHLAKCYLLFYSIWPNVTYCSTACGLMLPTYCRRNDITTTHPTLRLLCSLPPLKFPVSHLPPPQPV